MPFFSFTIQNHVWYLFWAHFGDNKEVKKEIILSKTCQSRNEWNSFHSFAAKNWILFLRKKIRFCTRKNAAKNIGAMVIKKTCKVISTKKRHWTFKTFFISAKSCFNFWKTLINSAKSWLCSRKDFKFYKQNHYK